MKQEEYLNQAKEKLGFTSDYALSLHIGIDRKQIQRYREEKAIFDDFMIFQLEEILGIDVKTIIIDVRSQSEKSENKKEFWIEQLRRKTGQMVFISGILGKGILLNETAQQIVYYVK